MFELIGEFCVIKLELKDELRFNETEFFFQWKKLIISTNLHRKCFKLTPLLYLAMDMGFLDICENRFELDKWSQFLSWRFSNFARHCFRHETVMTNEFVSNGGN